VEQVRERRRTVKKMGRGGKERKGGNGGEKTII